MVGHQRFNQIISKSLRTFAYLHYNVNSEFQL